MKINSKIAIGAGYGFTIIDSPTVKGIALKNTNQFVKVNGEIYPLYKGQTYEDSRNIDYILDHCNNEMNILAHIVNKYSITLCKGEPEEEIVLAFLSQEDIDVIDKCINGEYLSEFFIITEDDRKIDSGIIDEYAKCS